jgi:hypothetical protein
MVSRVIGHKEEDVTGGLNVRVFGIEGLVVSTKY